MSNYRLIIDDGHPGIWNMAVDEVLLTTASELQLATIRFYQWSTPTLSLGYFQKHGDRHLHAPSQDCPLVRRASGGGAILHDRELTYSLALPIQDRWARSTEVLFASVHNSLVETLRGFGIDATLHYGDSSAQNEFLCFARRSPGDVIVGGHKVAGSAQRRYRGAVLQHGSVLLKTSAAAPSLAGLWDLGGQSWSREQLSRTWLNALQERLQVEFHEGTLAKDEPERIKCVALEKFSQESWTSRR